MPFRVPLAPLTGLALLTISLTPPASAYRQDLITVDTLRAHVEHLASDAFMGRDTGEIGGRMASAYIAEALESYGLRPIPGRDDFFLPYTLFRAGFESEGTFVHVLGNEDRVTGESGVDLRPFPFSDEGEIEADVVFAGYGITAPDLGYDDYGDLDVSGKFVLVLRHEPGEKNPDSSFDGLDSSSHALFTSKAQNAQEHGALGMILVTDPLNHTSDGGFRAGGALSLDPPEIAEPDTTGESFLAVHVSRTLADALMASSGRELVEIQRGLDDGSLGASDISLGAARARVAVKRRDAPQEVATRNVAAYLEGSDPELRHEVIVVGGHHDHLGGFEGDGDTVYNGADDNASGTAGVLTMAQAFAAAEARPRRSIVFTTFSGEERGLLGSKVMVRDSQIPVDNVALMLNMDMIGRNAGEPLEVIGDGFARGMRELVERANEGVDLDLMYMGKGYMGNSDHDSFYRRDIPFVMFFTGIHEDYHQLEDHPEKLAYERMRDIVSLGASIVSEVASSEELPRFIHRISWLGVEVEVLGADESQEATVTGVDAGSRAQEMGFLVGDVLAAFGGDALEDPDLVGAEFRDIAPGTEASIDVLREGATHRIEVARARTGYLGVWPGEVDEDTRAHLGLQSTEGVLLRQVVAGGPSDEAGFEAGDILLSIAGRPVATGTLRNVLSQIGAGEPVDVRLVRDGERVTLPLTLGERPQQ